MGQYMRREERHPFAGQWGRSLWVWHRLEWVESGDGSETDGGSSCGRYVMPPYLSRFQVHHLVSADLICKKCDAMAKEGAE